MQITENPNFPTITGPLFDAIKQVPVKTGKKRGRKPLPFVPKPTPSIKVLNALKEQPRMSFDNLQASTKLTEDKLCLALTNLIINTRQVDSYLRNETRIYRLSSN